MEQQRLKAQGRRPVNLSRIANDRDDSLMDESCMHRLNLPENVIDHNNHRKRYQSMSHTEDFQQQDANANKNDRTETPQ